MGNKKAKWLSAALCLSSATVAWAGTDYKEAVKQGFGIAAILAFVFFTVKIWHLILTKDQRDNTMTEIIWMCIGAVGALIVGAIFTVGGMSGAVIEPQF